MTAPRKQLEKGVSKNTYKELKELSEEIKISLTYNEPTQVKWYDYEDMAQYGIAYKDYVICACCGSLIPIEQIYEDSMRDKPIETLDYWIDFSEFIK